MRKFNYNIEFREIDETVSKTLKTSSVSVLSPLLVDNLLCVDASPAIIVRDVTFISENLNKFQNVSDVQQMAIVERLRASVPSSDKLSDEELFSHMKSRYAQLPAEVDSYLNYINSNLDIIKSDIDSLVKSKASESPESSSSVES